MREQVIIYGAGKTGILVAEFIKQRYSSLHVFGFVDDQKNSHDYSSPILGKSSDLPNLRERTGIENIVLGFVLPVEKRLDNARSLQKEGFKFPSILADPYLKDRWRVQIGDGVCVYDATICPGTHLGNFSAVNSYSVIEDSIIGDGVIIAPQVFVGTGVNIGEGTFVYPGAKILPGVTIGEKCVIGPNVIVNREVENGQKFLRTK